jgi:tRNA(Ile)-lysidine synthase
MPTNSPSYLKARGQVISVLEKISDANKEESILVGVSGGADSLALAKVLFDVKQSLHIVPVIVDHSLQENSAEVAEKAKKTLIDIGYSEISIFKIQVELNDGIEASARRARYQAFHSALEKYQSNALLLAHTLDDQAETVLLGLSRGSGSRSLSGMKIVAKPFFRPFLELSRSDTEAICDEFKIEYWVDPFNSDLNLFRSKVRKVLRPVLEDTLGPQIYSSLARTAKILQNDQDYLMIEVNNFLKSLGGLDKLELPFVLELDTFSKLHSAIRIRIFRELLYHFGANSGKINFSHLLTMDELISNWHGQKGLDLPGEITLTRKEGKLWITREKSLG